MRIRISHNCPPFMLDEKRKPFLREIFPKRHKEWIRLRFNGEITKEEYEFLATKWDEMKKNKSLEGQAQQLAKDFNGEIVS